MNKANMDIRMAIAESGRKYWEVADTLGISDSTFTKWLRKELEPARKEMVFNATFGITPDKIRKCNQSIWDELERNHMTMTELAELMGISKFAMSRRLSKEEFSDKEKQRYIWIINNPDKHKEMIGK